MSFRRVWRSAASLFSLPVKRERKSSWKRSPAVKVMATARERASATVFPFDERMPAEPAIFKGNGKGFSLQDHGLQRPRGPIGGARRRSGAQDLGEGLADVDEAPHALKDELASLHLATHRPEPCSLDLEVAGKRKIAEVKRSLLQLLNHRS